MLARQKLWVSAFALLSAGALSLTCVTVSTSHESAALLPNTALASIVGDNTDENFCVEQSTCDVPRGSGDECVYCDTPLFLNVCCPSSQEKNCDFTGSDATCNDSKLFVGTTHTQSSCNQCSSAQFNQSGQCSGLKNARGDLCM